MSAPEASLSRWDPVLWYPCTGPWGSCLLGGRKEVLSGVALLLLARVVEVIEHQVHVGLVLGLKVHLYLLISVNFQLNVRFGLSAQGTGFFKVGFTESGVLDVLGSLLDYVEIRALALYVL
jgi:hypothetical protein